MKSFDQLTRLGKIRRQRKLVYHVLENYDIDVAAVHFLADHTNTLFKIVAKDGTRYALRIYSDGETTIKENRAEMFWLNAIARDTDLKITQPIPRKDGELLNVVNGIDGLPADQRCVLMSWIPGQALADAKGGLTAENYVKYGQALAKLHNHSETLTLPAHVNPKKWDKVFYYAMEPIVYNDPEYSHLFSAEQVAMIDEVVAISDKYLGDLFANQAGQMLIHGDLHFWNVHLHRGELYLIDFEDVNLGYDVQDVAITLYYGREKENIEELRAAFKEGYSSLRRWPLESDAQLKMLIAARMAMFTNYAAHILAADAAKNYVAQRCVELEQFLKVFG